MDLFYLLEEVIYLSLLLPNNCNVLFVHWGIWILTNRVADTPFQVIGKIFFSWLQKVKQVLTRPWSACTELLLAGQRNICPNDDSIMLSSRKTTALFNLSIASLPVAGTGACGFPRVQEVSLGQGTIFSFLLLCIVHCFCFLLSFFSGK